MWFRYLIFFLLFSFTLEFAGHSKWKNIKHTKSANDLKKTKLFNKVFRSLKDAIFHGGGNINPETNRKLAVAYDNAKKANVPVSTLNGFLEKMKKRKQNLQTVVFEYRGPSGLLVVITAQTDDKGKTRNDIHRYTKKHNLKLSEDVLLSFDYKGYIYWKPPADIKNPDEKALEDAIEVGAEEVCRDEDDPEQIKFICDGKILASVKTKLQSRNYEIADAEDLYVPKQCVEIDENTLKILSEVFEKIESEVSDVNAIYSNIA